MFLSQPVSCFRCRTTLGYKAADGEGVGPIYCAKCVDDERADLAEAAKHTEAYRAAAARARS